MIDFSQKAVTHSLIHDVRSRLDAAKKQEALEGCKHPHPGHANQATICL
jgi:hypothetical protein